MRKYLSKRKRERILRLGGKIESEGWICERGWRRRDCGYGVTILYKGWHMRIAGEDEFDAFKLALEEMRDNWSGYDEMDRKWQ